MVSKKIAALIRLVVINRWAVGLNSLAVLSTLSTGTFAADRNAAMLDWESFPELSVAHQGKIKPYCEGAYVAPNYLSSYPSVEPGAIYIAADNADGNLESVMELTGDVRILRDSLLLRSDWATFNLPKSDAALKGNILLRSPDFVMSGEEAFYNTALQDFRVKEVSYLFYQNELRGEADQFSSDGQQRVIIDDGSFTTCPPQKDHWSIAASEIELDREEGFGTAKHATLRIQDVPVVYFPYFSFPIDDRRKSGFLYPSIGSSNSGRGIYFTAPYYLNLAENYDATITPSYIHGRGLLSEVEFRYLNSWGLSDLDLGYIHNDDDYDAELASNDPQRWALSFENRSRISPEFTSLISYKVVSDNDYLSDLDRSLDINEVSHLERKWRLGYDRSSWQAYSLVHDFQTIDDDILEEDEPYARLPELGINYDRKISAIRYSAEGQYVNFYRDNANLSGSERVNGQRLTVLPGVMYEYEPEWGFLKAGGKVHHTDYFLEDHTGQTESHLSRTLPVAIADAGLYFDRDEFAFNPQWSQTLEPRLYYVHRAYKDQSLYPDFDSDYRDFSFSSLFQDNRFTGGDRIADSHRLSTAVTSRINDRATGREIGRLSLGQIYYFDDREVALDSEGAGTRSDSPFAGELVVSPVSWVDFTASAIWDGRNSNTEEGALSLKLHSDDYRWVFNAGHRYLEGELEQSNVSAIVPVTEQISLFGRWLYELQDNRTIGSVAGVEYESCCWRIQLFNRSYLTSDETVDHGFLLQFELKGLGRVRSGSRSGDLIDGYGQREQLMR